MKTICLIILMFFSFTVAQAQLVAETDVPAAAVEKFYDSNPDLSQNIKISWYLLKSNSYPDKVLYKTTYMNGTHFETWGYAQNGNEIYVNFDYYHAKDADQQVISKVKETYPNLTINRISSFKSDRYAVSGYSIRFEDKARYFSNTGEETGVNPWPKIENAAFSDPTNFTNASTQPEKGKSTPVSTSKKLMLKGGN